MARKPELVINLTENSNMDHSDIKSKDKPNSKYLPIPRTRKQPQFFRDENFSNRNKKRSRTECNDTECNDKEKQKSPSPLTHEEIRKKHVEKIKSVVGNYILSIVDVLDLLPEREIQRLLGLVKNTQNATSLANKVHVSNSMGYLVSSSDGSSTYSVNPIHISNSIRYVCNCGKKYQDENRTSCKHVGAVIFYIFGEFIKDFLAKPYRPNVGLQLHHVNKSLGKIDIEKKNPTQKDHLSTSKNEMVESVPIQEEDYFSYLLNRIK